MPSLGALLARVGQRIRVGAVPAGLGLVAGLAWAAPAAGQAQHALAMHGQPAYPADFSHFAYVNPDAPKGGLIRQGVVGTFDHFHPFVLDGNPASVGLIYDTLMDSSADEPFTQYGLLAETVETPEDRSWVLFRLRPQARWHDGTSVTADDVIWTFNMLREKGHPFYRFYYRSVREATRVGERGVRFDFIPGENRELPLILGQLPVLPQAFWEGKDFGKPLREMPMGSGPYRISRAEPGRFLELERVSDYWGQDLPVNRGRHNFDTRRLEYFRDSQVAVEAFKGGAFDIRPENNSRIWATAYDVPAREQGMIVQHAFSHQRPTGMQGFIFNLRRPVFQDIRVRQALAEAFDFEWTNNTLFYKQYRRTASYFSNSEMQAEGLPSPQELVLLEPLRDQLDPELFRSIYQPPSTDGSGRIRRNLGKAMELLTRAGWKLDDSSTLVHAATGRPFRFQILLVSPDFERVVLPFIRNLKRIGIDASVRTLDAAQYQNRIKEFDFDMIIGGWGQSESPGNELRDYWSSEAADTRGSRNYPGIRSPVVDQLIGQVIAAKTREDLVIASKALDRVLLSGHYVIPQYHINHDRIAFWNRFGMPEKTPSRGVQLDTWWLDRVGADRVDAFRKGG